MLRKKQVLTGCFPYCILQGFFLILDPDAFCLVPLLPVFPRFPVRKPWLLSLYGKSAVGQKQRFAAPLSPHIQSVFPVRIGKKIYRGRFLRFLNCMFPH